VWFVWEERRGTLLVYSQRHKAKLRHLTRSRRVAVHFNTDPDGDDVVVLTGQARVDRRALPAHRRADYMRKYRSAIRDLGMTPASFAQEYAVAIRLRPDRLRGW
jgi:PPOX class probable F420-dependent enzyme